MKKFLHIFILILITSNIIAQFNLDAGIIDPFTKTAKLSVSSGVNAENIRDGRADTFWESGNPLPEAFINNKAQNLFLDNQNYELVSANNKYMMAFDGNTDTKVTIDESDVHIKIYNNKPLKFLVIKFTTSGKLEVELKFSDGKSQTSSFSSQQNYSLQSVDIKIDKPVKEIILRSDISFDLFELAAVGSNISEWIKFEFAKPIEIGVIISNHLNWDGVDSIQLLYSNDSNNWFWFANLNPKAVAMVAMEIKPLIYARYLLIKIFTKPLPYNKANFREFAVYDRYGQFGKPPEALPSSNTWGESFGVNGIWGWGYGVPSSKLNDKQGSAKFDKITNQARNYHRIDWDIAAPGGTPEFLLRENTNDSLANKWLNWKEEYGIWKSNNMDIDACILFNNEYFPEAKWTSPFEQGKQYANQFSDFFGSRKIVNLVEIGNEPWDYSKWVYSDILKGMAEGFSTSKHNMKVLPCGLQAFEKYPYSNNYIADFILAGTKISGLNTHIYSYIFDNDGIRKAINPEDPRSETWSVNNLNLWALENNFPDNIYVTEFGFDSDGGGEDCTHSNCISEYEQAIFGFRQAMIFFRLGVKKFYWYFYANVDWNSILHNRSGLLSSYSAGFEEKLSFKAFKTAFPLIKNLYFKEVINEDDNLYCFALGDEAGKITALIAWRPTEKNHKEYKWEEIKGNYLINSVMDVTKPEEKISYKREVGKTKISLSGSPVIILLR